jgi:hypothetical protein
MQKCPVRLTAELQRRFTRRKGRGAKNGKNGRHRVFISIFLMDKPSI